MVGIQWIGRTCPKIRRPFAGEMSTSRKISSQLEVVCTTAGDTDDEAHAVLDDPPPSSAPSHGVKAHRPPGTPPSRPPRHGLARQSTPGAKSLLRAGDR